MHAPPKVGLRKSVRSSIGCLMRASTTTKSTSRTTAPRLMGHGIGRRIHEAPEVPNIFVPELSEPLTDGLVITIEPLVAAGRPEVRMRRDGWTVSTADGSDAAHTEHTIVVRDGAPLVLTA